jgi:hypothetical protein
MNLTPVSMAAPQFGARKKKAAEGNDQPKEIKIPVTSTETGPVDVPVNAGKPEEKKFDDVQFEIPDLSELQGQLGDIDLDELKKQLEGLNPDDLKGNLPGGLPFPVPKSLDEAKELIKMFAPSSPEEAIEMAKALLPKSKDEAKQLFETAKQFVTEQLKGNNLKDLLEQLTKPKGPKQ